MRTITVDVDLSEFDDEDIRQEYIDRFKEAPVFGRLDEIGDLMAEAAFTSTSAALAYALLRDAFPAQFQTLSARQNIINARMRRAA